MIAKFCYLLFFILCVSAGCSGPLQTSKKTKIKAIVFDFGGVFVKTDREEVKNFIVKSLNISPKEAEEALVELKEQMAKGESEENFWINVATARDIKLSDDWKEKLNEARFQALKMIPGMISLVKELQTQGFQIALLSNVKESRAQIKRKLGFYELFQPALFSYEIGVSKPDPKAYHILLEKLKLPPENVLFVDNKLQNETVAKELGIDAVLFTDAEHLREELKQRGIEVSIPAQHPSSVNK